MPARHADAVDQVTEHPYSSTADETTPAGKWEEGAYKEAPSFEYPQAVYTTCIAVVHLVGISTPHHTFSS